MIVWTGCGILTPFIAFIPFIAIQVIVDSIFGKPFYKNHMSMQIIAVLASSALVWFSGRQLNSAPGRVMIDKASGQEVVLKSSHTLFFVKMEYWAVLIAILGLFMVIIQTQ
jgi:hypothetical protein